MGFSRLGLSGLVLLMVTMIGAGAGWLVVGGWPGEAAAYSPPKVTERHSGPKADASPAAGGNILGLVVPRDPRHTGAVLLHGGGPVTNDVCARFIRLAGGRQARLVLVPSASYGPTGYDSRREFANDMKRRFSSWVRLASTGRVRKFEFLYTDDPDDADDPAFVRPLESATGVWFCGGDQWQLNYRYVGEFPRRTRFQEAVRGVLARGGAVGGTSAGMAALPEIMTLYQDRQSARGPYTAVAAHGLSLFDGAIVEQHFDERGGRVERFLGLLRDSARLDRLAERRGAGERMLGLAVERSAALVVRGDRLETIGGGNVHVLIKSGNDRTITWRTLKAGEHGELQRDAHGQVVLSAGR
jgi:cyanophycinase